MLVNVYFSQFFFVFSPFYRSALLFIGIICISRMCVCVFFLLVLKKESIGSDFDVKLNRNAQKKTKANPVLVNHSNKIEKKKKGIKDEGKPTD